MNRLYLCFVGLLVLLLPVLAHPWGFNWRWGGNSGSYIDLAPLMSDWEHETLSFPETNVGESSVLTNSFTNSGTDFLEDVIVYINGTDAAMFRNYSATGAAFFNLSSGRTFSTKVKCTPASAGAKSAYLNYTAPNITRRTSTLACTGVASDTYSDILLFWRAESQTMTTGDYPTSGAWTPGSGTPTISATAAKIGSYGVLATAGYAHYTMASVSGALLDPIKGRVGFWYRMPTSWQGAPVWKYNVDSNNWINIYTTSGGNITVDYRSGGTGHGATSPSANLLANTWYFFEYKWDTTTNTYTIYSNGNSIANTTPTITAISSTGIVDVGLNNATAITEYIDNIMISNNPNRDFWGGGIGLCINTSSPR